MLASLVEYRLDILAVTLLAVGGGITLHRWLRRHPEHGGVPPVAWTLLAVIILGGAALTEFAGKRERDRLRDMLSGIAPTYAQEIQLLGHSKITPDTPADDPTYLSMIQAESRWTRVNPNVNDVYTFRQRDDGKIVFIVDAETDYDRNGKYEGDREQRTAIGEEYDETTQDMLDACKGVAKFDGLPVTDRWGTWVSAYVPLVDSSGNVEAVLGVDYDASTWAAAIARARASAVLLVAILVVTLLAATAIVAMTHGQLAIRAAAEKERAALHRQLLAASRQAGMAEVATGVLHNVGNVLNSVTVSVGVMAQRLAHTKLPGLIKATDMLRDRRNELPTFLTTDPRGKVLPDYLTQLAGLLSAEYDDTSKELTRLTQSVEHIKRIVESQQQFARGTTVTETLDLAEVLDEALRIAEPSFANHAIEIVRRYTPCPQIDGDRHQLLQIVSNLLSNAKRAVSESPTKRVTVSLHPTATSAHITITDTGTGISTDNLAKLFSHGFTTAKDGHGFGLHHSAIAANQMKGTLTAHSDGPGHGATFTLLLPLKPAETTTKAAA